MSAAILPFRPFKIPPSSTFLEKKKQLSIEFMTEDLARSGLVPGDLFAYAQTSMRIPKEAETGYVIPYFDPKGQPVVGPEECPAMYRVRLKARANLPCPRYVQPHAEELAAQGLPSNMPYLPPYKREESTIYICEGEKKTVAVIKYLGLDAIGIGGCNTWNHQWIFDACAGKKVVLIPDADIQRYDISKAYGSLAYELKNRGCVVDIVVPPDKIDDWIMRGNRYDEFLQLPTLNPDDLVVGGDALIKAYNLTFNQTKDGRRIPHQHNSNVTILLEAHPAFPVIWNNLDNSRVYIGSDVVESGHTEHQITNYFQRNFGMDRVTPRIIRDVMGSLCIKNKRSPMLEWVQGQVWDRKDRLETWMIRHWGCEDSPHIREVSSKWIISACARMSEPGVKLDWIFITIGPQATGKTTMPEILFRGNNVVCYGHDEGKDAKLMLHSALCIGYDELDGMAKREQSTLKAMITCREDAFRKPYGADVQVYPRRSVLYGCGNNPAFLTEDSTGYRRYAVVKVPRLLDFDGLEKEVGQLWAEAWYRYENDGVRYWEVETAAESAREFVVESSLTIMIHTALERFAKDGIDRFTSNQLYGHMGLDITCGRVPLQISKDIANTMYSLGWAKKNMRIPSLNNESREGWYHLD
jgi:hypothetical protein